jgi:proteasome lid subunit RPN8/RPN11
MITTGIDSYREFWSQDHRFGLRMRSSHIKEIISRCIDSYPNETGGILVGLYNQNLDCAEITNIFFAPPDSGMGKTWFVRGVQGLQSKLNQLWIGKKGYYLGEWHFHPGGVSYPSSQDINQMHHITSLPDAHCPEPILFIVNGLATKDTFSCRAYVFSNHQSLELVAR